MPSATATHLFPGDEGKTFCDRIPGTWTFYCALQPSDIRVAADGTVANEARDTFVGKPKPDTNHANADFLRVTPDWRAGTKNISLLQFDLAKDLPSNITVNEAFLRLYFSLDGTHYPPASLRESSKTRELFLYDIEVPWDEETIAWNDIRTLYEQNAFRNDTGIRAKEANSGGGTVRMREWDIAKPVRSAIQGSGHTLGWTVEDPLNTCVSECSQVFYSSHARTGSSAPLTVCPKELFTNPDGVCWPLAYVQFDPNRPEIESVEGRYNATVRVNQTPSTRISSVAPINISVDVKDAKGRIRYVHVTLENETGFRYVGKDLPNSEYNSSLDPTTNPGDRRRYWFNGVISEWAGRSIPEGLYYLNYTVVDSDNLKFWVNASRPGLRVDNKVPVIQGVEVKGPRAFNQGGWFNLSADIRRPEGRVDSVQARLVRETDNATFMVRMHPLPSVFGYERAGRYFVNRTFEVPGTFSITVYANDILGNWNTTPAGRLHVIDTVKPVLSDPQFTAPDQSPEEYRQEVGGGLSARVTMVDADPLTRVEFRVLDAEGANEIAPRVPFTRISGNTFGALGFRINISLSADRLVRLEYVATDSDGNVGRLAAKIPVRLYPPAPPVFRSITPAPDAWANETPRVTLIIADPNLDRVRVDASVKIGSTGVFTPVAIEFSGPLAQSLAVFPNQAFTNGTRITYRVNASDTLGQSSQLWWNFTVDGITPSSTLDVGSPQTTTSASLVITNRTSFTLAGSDAQSGISHLEIQLANLDKNRESGWIRYPGTFNVTSFPTPTGKLPTYIGNGLYAVRSRAVDRVGNVELDREFRALVDDQAPRVTARLLGDDLVVTGTESGDAGFDKLLIYWRIGGAGAFTEVDASERLATARGGTITIPVGPVPKSKDLQVAFFASDKLGNERWNGSLQFPQRIRAPNHAPTLLVDMPATGSEVKDRVKISWDVKDPDGDRLTFKIRIRPVVQSFATDLLPATSEVRGETTWDTRAFSDGMYELVAAVSDFEQETNRTVRVLVNNTGLGVGTVDAPKTVAYREPAIIEIKLLRPVIGAKLRVLIVDGDTRSLVQEVLLVDDGTGVDRKAGDHIYSASFTPPSKGRYVAEAVVTYQDAGTVTTQVADFQVEETWGAWFARNWAWVTLAGAALVIIGIVIIVQLIRYGHIG